MEIPSIQIEMARWILCPRVITKKWYSFIKCIPQLALWIIVEVVSWISIESIKSRTVIRGPRSSDIHIFTISQEIPQPAITKIRLKITNLKFHSNFPGANDFQTSSVMKPVKCLSVYHQLWYRLCNTNGPLSSKRGGGGGGGGDLSYVGHHNVNRLYKMQIELYVE